MMNNISITDSEQFEEVINSLEKSHLKIREIALNQNNNKELINGTEIWTGNAQTSMYNKYSLLMKNFEKIDYSLDVYIKFLRKTLEDYKLVEKEISNNIDQIANELDVNS